MIRRYRLLVQLPLVIVAVIFLTSCGDHIDPARQLDHVAQLPLWQKVLAIGLFSIVSEDLACIAAGMLASEGVITFGWAFTGAFLGGYLGDIPLYLMGRLGGVALLRKRPFRWFIREHQIDQAESLFKEHGAKLIFSSRLLPGSRVPIFVAAGVLRYPFGKFMLYMFLAVSISTLILTWGSMQLGEIVIRWLKVYETYFFPVFFTGVALIWIVVKTLEILATRRSRLTFLSRCRKLYYRVRPRVRSRREAQGSSGEL